MEVDATLGGARTSFTATFSSLIWVLTTGAQFVLVWWYRKQPVFWLPKGWVPGLAGWILSFPSAPAGQLRSLFPRAKLILGLGSVSSAAWGVVCKRVLVTGEEIVRTLILPAPG